jgi:hypothetical protein
MITQRSLLSPQKTRRVVLDDDLPSKILLEKAANLYNDYNRARTPFQVVEDFYLFFFW